jgi:hypothetical protein
VLLEKPLVLVVPEGRTVSPKLEGIADRISTVDLESEAGRQRVEDGCGGSSPTSPNNDRSIRLPALWLREPHHPKRNTATLGDLFTALMTVNLIDLINDGQYISRVVAYKKIEFWQHGNRLGDVDGMRLIAEHYPEIVDAITN